MSSGNLIPNWEYEVNVSPSLFTKKDSAASQNEGVFAVRCK